LVNKISDFSIDLPLLSVLILEVSGEVSFDVLDSGIKVLLVVFFTLDKLLLDRNNSVNLNENVIIIFGFKASVSDLVSNETKGKGNSN
jgi:hypothetical protein